MGEKSVDVLVATDVARSGSSPSEQPSSRLANITASSSVKRPISTLSSFIAARTISLALTLSRRRRQPSAGVLAPDASAEARLASHSSADTNHQAAAVSAPFHADVVPSEVEPGEPVCLHVHDPDPAAGLGLLPDGDEAAVR